jgi:hypothetical protein
VRALVAVVAVLVGVLLLLELLAVPLGSRQLTAALEDHVDAVEEVEVTGIARPASPGIVLGRARDVEVTATGVERGTVRIAHVRLRADEVDLPWRPGAPSSRPADVEARVLAGDLQRTLRELAPVPVPLELELRPGVAAIGAPLVPVDLELTAQVEVDGTVAIRPAGALELLDRLGLSLRFPPTEDLRPTAVVIADGELVVRGEVELRAEPGAVPATTGSRQAAPA